jgi:hypothetical protein
MRRSELSDVIGTWRDQPEVLWLKQPPKEDRPHCKECGCLMRLKVSQHEMNFGVVFYACSKRGCRSTQSLWVGCKPRRHGTGHPRPSSDDQAAALMLASHRPSARQRVGVTDGRGPCQVRRSLQVGVGATSRRVDAR